jgi:hypothetical protein
MFLNYHKTNLLLFTLERCDDWHATHSAPFWRVRSRNIFGWYPCWGPYEPSRTRAVFSWVKNVLADLLKP